MKPFPNRKYPLVCSKCGHKVPVDEGLLTGRNDAGHWIGEHNGDCPTEADVATSAPVVVSKATFAPTPEQLAVLELFGTKRDFVAEAGAGTGKTSTLELLARSTERRGHYFAFGRAIAEEGKRRFPKNVSVSTIHSLAHTAIVKSTAHLADRLENDEKQRYTEVARTLGLTIPFVVEEGHYLQPERLGGIVIRSIDQFCQTADKTPGAKHVVYVEGIDAPTKAGKRTYKNNKRFAKTLAPYLKAAWNDIATTHGKLSWRQKHNYYLKLWQLSDPIIDVDFLLLDEAHDAIPVILSVIEQQTCQRVLVGDAQQAIFEFTGAVNAIEKAKALGWPVRQLTKSFRFGPAVAGAANEILAKLNADLRVVGHDPIKSVVGAFNEEPDAVLTRTNAAAVAAVLEAQERGVKAFLVGGGAEVLAFARGVRDLQNKGRTTNPDLIAFNSWGEVLDYAKTEEGADLKLNVDLIERYGLQTIFSALENLCREQDADLVISTAHKAKGREWDKVLIASDFVKKNKDGSKSAQPVSEQELRLQYVACTRAKLKLDHTVLQEIDQELEEEES